MQADTVSDQFRRQHIALEELPEQNNAGDDENTRPVGYELRQRDGNRQHQRRQRADIRDEADQPRHDTDEQAEAQSRH
jgi:hypothetical protein